MDTQSSTLLLVSSWHPAILDTVQSEQPSQPARLSNQNDGAIVVADASVLFLANAGAFPALPCGSVAVGLVGQAV